MYRLYQKIKHACQTSILPPVFLGLVSCLSFVLGCAIIVQPGERKEVILNYMVNKAPSLIAGVMDYAVKTIPNSLI